MDDSSVRGDVTGLFEVEEVEEDGSVEFPEDGNDVGNDEAEYVAIWRTGSLPLFKWCRTYNYLVNSDNGRTGYCSVSKERKEVREG